MQTSNIENKKSKKVTRFKFESENDQPKSVENKNKLVEVSTNLKTFEKIEIKKLNDTNNNNNNENQTDTNNQLPQINGADQNQNNEIAKISKSVDEFDHLPSIVKSSHQMRESKSISVSIFNAIKYVDYFPLKPFKV